MSKCEKKRELVLWISNKKIKKDQSFGPIV